MVIDSDFTIAQSIIDGIPSSKLEYHKELLYDLFLFSEVDDTQHDAPYPSESTNSKKK